MLVQRATAKEDEIARVESIDAAKPWWRYRSWTQNTRLGVMIDRKMIAGASSCRSP